MNILKGLFGGASEGVHDATQLAPASAPEGLEAATFAGGCFWGLELAFQRLPCVRHTSVGYTQGHVPNPTYQQVCSGSTGHAEAVQVYYEGREAAYQELLDVFFQRTDPTTLNRQGNDAGSQYRSGIYFHTEQQRVAAERAVAQAQAAIEAGTFGRPTAGKKVVVEVKPAGEYYLAEQYHQQYLEKGGQCAAKGSTDRIACYG